MNKHLYMIMPNTEVLYFAPTEYQLLPDNYIKLKDFNPCPLEDIEWIMSDTYLSNEEAFRNFINLM